MDNMEKGLSTRISELNPKSVNFFNVRKYIGIVKDLIELLKKEFQRLQYERDSLFNEKNKFELESKDMNIKLRRRSQGLDKREAELKEKEDGINELKERLKKIESEYRDKIKGDSTSEVLLTKPTEIQQHNSRYLDELISFCSIFDVAVNEIVGSTGTTIDSEEDNRSTENLLSLEGQLLAVLEMKRELWSIDKPVGYKQLSELISKRLNEAIRDCEIHDDSKDLGLIEAFVNTIAVQFDWLLYLNGIFTFEYNNNEYCFNNEAISQSVKKLINCPDTYKANLEGVVQALLDSEYFIFTFNRKDVYQPIGSARITEHIQFMIDRGIISRQDGDSSKIGYEEHMERRYGKAQERICD